MPLNQLKKYNQLLELNQFTERQRDMSLKGIFNRDIVENNNFIFRGKFIHPFKKDGEPALETLFSHLTRREEFVDDELGNKIRSRNVFDLKRSERLHWVWHHIQEKEKIKIFSYNDRKDGKNVIRTYLFDEKENYVIVLEPYKKTNDYYLLTAYYLEDKYNGPKTIKKKYQRRLTEIY
jgi:hypothetical protein